MGAIALCGFPASKVGVWRPSSSFCTYTEKVACAAPSYWCALLGASKLGIVLTSKSWE